MGMWWEGDERGGQVVVGESHEFSIYVVNESRLRATSRQSLRESQRFRFIATFRRSLRELMDLA